MSIIGKDDREVITTFKQFPYSTVTAVDYVRNGKNLNASGITIGPNHVLIAGHTAYNATTNTTPTSMRTTTSANEDALTSRTIGAHGDPAANVTKTNFPANFKTTDADADDIALLTTSDAPLAAKEVIGLMAFVDPKKAKNLTIDTAGYPRDNVSSNIPRNTGATLRDLVRAPKATEAPGEIVNITANRVFHYSEDIDTAIGQSGSGVWHTLDGDSKPRVLGIHTGWTSRSNRGTLINEDIYDEIIKQMENDSGTGNANDLPENAIIGSDKNDYIVGSYRKERILGNDGDDKLLGGGANDRLEGGDGTDQALFSDIFTNYDFEITDPANPAFEFNHVRGSQTDGTDSTKDIEFGVFEYVDITGGEDNKPDGVDDDGNVFFVPLQVDPDDPTKLKDGPKITPEEDILDDQGDKIGTLTVESPAWMFDGDVKYNLNIGSDQSIVYNLAYIVDSSGSMSGNPMTQTKLAYQRLTEFLIDEGIADNSTFGVVDFDSYARLYAPLDGASTISTVNGLGAGGGTNFEDALQKAKDFFEDPARNNNATNIAYFLSDGYGSGASSSLQSVAEVRAFGIGGADLSTLQIIDSDGDVSILVDPSQLADEFKRPPIEKDEIERIDVKLGGNVIETITPNQLDEDTLGLKFEGTIDGLEVTRTAENEITFDLVFNNGTPTTSLDYKITTGQEQVTTLSKNGTIIITFSANQADFTDAAPAPNSAPLMSESISSLQTQSLTREIIGNDLDNVIQVQSGENTIFGNGGDDRFILLGGINLVDGGEGIDTVEINQTKDQAGGVSQSGNIVSIGTDHTLLNVEFIEFTDVRLAIDGSGVTPTPTLSLANNSLSITEGNSGSSFATFTVNLSHTTTEDVVIDYSTRPDYADAGTDFVATTGQLIIPAGQNSGDISVEILGDTEVEGDESLFLDLDVVSGGTFANGATTETSEVNIIDDDSIIDILITDDDLTVIEGNPNSPSTLTLTLDRFGSLNGTDTVEVEILAGGSNPAQASDLVNGFSSSQITFAPGEDTKTVDIEINPDQEIESDETFAVKLTSVSGSASVPNQDIIFTILDDDNNGILVEGTPGKDNLFGADGDDTLRGFGDRDLLDGGAGADLMEGGDGKDTYIVDNPGDVVVETNPSDKDGKDVVESSIDFTLPDNYVENLTLTGNAINGTGNSLNNFIVGNNSDNYLQGKDGKDKLMGRGGADTLDGGAGDDEYTIVDADDTLIDSAGFDTVRSEVDWTLADGFERLVLINKKNVTHLNGTGNSLDNIIIGNKVINTLVGGDGNDEIHGKKGNDTLIGGNDADTLTGGDGNDSFQFNDETDGIDRITDFNVADDTILVNGSNFGGGLVAGAAITPAQFNLGSSASTSAHRFIYNSSNGALWFDANGSNSAGAVQIAQLNAGLGLTNQDIYVI